MGEGIAMVDGFWIVQYQGVQGGGGGVLMFTKGKIFGGDSGYTYMGTYQSDDITLKGRVTVRQFLAGVPNDLGIVGDFELDIVGTVEGDIVRGTASLVGRQGTGLAVKLTRKSNLP
jgi:hypothetical protein